MSDFKKNSFLYNPVCNTTEDNMLDKNTIMLTAKYEDSSSSLSLVECEEDILNAVVNGIAVVDSIFL